MTTGEEKTVLTLKSIVKYCVGKKIALMLICLYMYLDPTWFPTGLTAIALVIVLAVDLGLDLIITGIKLGIIGIHQEVRVKRT